MNFRVNGEVPLFTVEVRVLSLKRSPTPPSSEDEAIGGMSRRLAKADRQSMKMRSRLINMPRPAGDQNLEEASLLLQNQERLRAANMDPGYGAVDIDYPRRRSQTGLSFPNNAPMTENIKFDVSELAVKMAKSGVVPFFESRPWGPDEAVTMAANEDVQYVGEPLELMALFALGEDGIFRAVADTTPDGPAIIADLVQEVASDAPDVVSRRRRGKTSSLASRTGENENGEVHLTVHGNDGSPPGSVQHGVSEKKFASKMSKVRRKQRRARDVKKKKLERMVKEQEVAKGQGAGKAWWFISTHLVEIGYVVVLCGMFTAFAFGWSLGWTCIGTATVLSFMERTDGLKLFEEVNYPRIFYLLGMFVVVAGFTSTWVPSYLWNSLLEEDDVTGKLLPNLALYCVAALAMAVLLSPVVAVMLIAHLVSHYNSHTELYWLLLAWIMTLSGNLTQGSNLTGVIVTQAAKPYNPISPLEWIRFSALSVSLTLPLGLLWIYATSEGNSIIAGQGEADNYL